jgi:hypothetical protein
MKPYFQLFLRFIFDEPFQKVRHCYIDDVSLISLLCTKARAPNPEEDDFSSHMRPVTSRD